jgi:hypothetical protein
VPTPASDEASVSHSSTAPTICAEGHLVTGSGFLPDHRVAIRITRAGEDIDDYLTYVTDGDGCLHSDLPSGVTGKLYIAQPTTAPIPKACAAGCGAIPAASPWLGV